MKKDGWVYFYRNFEEKKKKVFKYSKHEVNEFTNNHIMSLLDKLSNENKDIVIMGDFNINLINYNNDKHSGHFFDTMLSQSFLP